ncbi:HAD family hydrolase [Sphingobium sp. Cam5-1]|uniref:HAD family hydrolase n=1 Tax=Sphingobium sp. Cam5-1 TaxID=2789327 RepID=UPI001E4BB372|nr:HAD family hydrolase [Sphingobium sp. Cam5-1]
MMPFSSESTRFEHVIVFDLDDTLYLERDYVLSGLRAVGQWASSALGIKGLGEVMRSRFDAGRRSQIFDDSLQEMGLAPSPLLIARMLATYRQHRPDICLAPDAERFLAGRDGRTGFAVITDGFLDAQRRKIRALGLYGRGIHLGICTDTWGRECWKPNPRAFEHVEQIFGRAGGSLTYVADNPSKDFTAPQARGWRTVRIARPDRIHQFGMHEGVKADRIIETLEEL